MPRGLPRHRRQYRVVRVPLKKVSHLLRKSASREYCRRVPCSSVSLRPGEGKAVVVLSCSAVTVQRQIRRSGVKRTVSGNGPNDLCDPPERVFFPRLCVSSSALPVWTVWTRLVTDGWIDAGSRVILVNYGALRFSACCGLALESCVTVTEGTSIDARSVASGWCTVAVEAAVVILCYMFINL